MPPKGYTDPLGGLVLAPSGNISSCALQKVRGYADGLIRNRCDTTVEKYP